MVAIWHEFEEVDNVNETNLEIGKVVSKKCGCGESFLRRCICLSATITFT